MMQLFKKKCPSHPQFDVLHLLPELSWVALPTGALIFLNHRANAYLGEVGHIGHWREVLHVDDAAPVAESGQMAACRLRDHAGRYHWFEVHATRLPGGDNLLFSARDIHASRTRELALRKKLETQAAMLNASIDCIKVIAPDGNLQNMNRSGCLALGVPLDSSFGMEWMDLLPADVRDGGNAALAAARAGKTGRFPGRSEVAGQPTLHWDNVLTPVLDQDGNTSSILCLSRDVTAERALQDQLRQDNIELEDKVRSRSAELSRLWRSSLHVLLVIDTQDNIARANPAWTDALGFEADDAANRPFCAFASQEDRHLCDKLLSASASRSLAPTEIRHRHRDGSLRWISWFAVKTPYETYLTGRDVTKSKAADIKLRETEEALRHAQKIEALGKMVGNVAHDFNNLLSAMRQALMLLSLPNCSPATVTRCNAILSSTTEQAIGICRQLLDFARRTPLTPKVFCVIERLESSRDMFAMICGAGIDIDIKSTTRPCLISADLGQFDTTLINLVTNAAHAMQGSGALTLSASITDEARVAWRQDIEDGYYVAVAVTDTGVGIPKEMQAEIFEPFFTTKEVGIGTGLGLSQVQGFAEHSGGTVGVDSSVGNGTTLTLYMPASQREACLVSDNESAFDDQ